MRIRYLLLHAYGTGGTIRTVINQANSMVAVGHDVQLVSVLRRRDEPAFPLDPRVGITTIVDQRDGAEDARPDHGPLARYRAWSRARLAQQQPKVIPQGEFGIDYFDRHVEKEVARYLRGLSAGILVTTRPALNILAARYAPASVTRVGQEHMNLSTHRKDVRAAIARYYPRLDAIAVLTHRDREEYEQLLPGTRIVRIPNAIHSLDQEPADHTAKVAVAAGRLVPQKGFDMLIPAFEQVVEHHPDWQLRIYGAGKKKAELRALIEEHHLYNNVFLMGHTSHLDDELAKASFYVLSSRFEGLPMVMIEAMAHALPVVSFDCPTGPADVLTDGTEGFLVPAQDVAGLAHAMGRLMADESLRAKMGTAAVATARNFSEAVVRPQWEELFAELTGADAADTPEAVGR
ncbi:MAG: glycosyltransferase family 4 protein [Nocardiopsaceae bacterium]|nr:glycosyltransferase family 4 protein [Nocardiopsaceae bacterium]